MDTNYLKRDPQSSYVSSDAEVEAAVLEFLNSWDEDYLCGCGLDKRPASW